MSLPSTLASENLDAASTGDGTQERSSEAEAAAVPSADVAVVGLAPSATEEVKTLAGLSGRLTSGHWSRQQRAQAQSDASSPDWEGLVTEPALDTEPGAARPRTIPRTNPVNAQIIVGRRLVASRNGRAGDEGAVDPDFLFVRLLPGERENPLLGDLVG